MLEARHRPAATRRITNAFDDQVPPIIAAYILTLIESAKDQVDEMDLGHALRKIQDDFAIEHVPDRETFEQSYLRKRISPAEVKVCPNTDRVYLVGLGLPGREELITRMMTLEGTDIKQPVTDSVIRDDTVLVYTEVSWHAYHTATRRAGDLPDHVRQGLTQYFQVPPHYLSGTLLATPSLTDEDLFRIASYAATMA